jgi:hypothetical protein
VNLFALIYLTRVIGLDEGTSGAHVRRADRLQRADAAPRGWLSDDSVASR